MGQLELSVGFLGNRIRLMGVATIFLVGGGGRGVVVVEVVLEVVVGVRRF